MIKQRLQRCPSTSDCRARRSTVERRGKLKRIIDKIVFVNFI
jgi:hypothetical protein